uniref:Caspase recruitment domain family member 10 n=1 Tax=Ursus maritimus TaxID=29073 RepID=A0A452UKA6_URSMA
QERALNAGSLAPEPVSSRSFILFRPAPLHRWGKVKKGGRLMDILRCRGKRGYEAFLESLEFYYPEHFTLLTGQEPAQRCSMILDEEGPEGLTQFLMTEVRRLREAQSQQQREQQLQARGRELEEERARLEQRLRDQQQAQERCQRLREDWEAGSLELLRIKCIRVDQLKLKVSRLEEECTLLRRTRGPLPAAEDKEKDKEPDSVDLVSELRAENQRLTASLQELQEGLQQEASRLGAPGSERILLDILEHDWREAQDSRQELCQKLHAVQGELQWAEELRDKYLQEMEDLRLKHRTLQKDCDLYKHRMATVLAQLEEIEKERDQAIQSRDRIQLQYSQSLIEKDQYRKQVRGLEAERDELLTSLTSLEGAKALLEAQLQRVQGGPCLKACASSHSLCSNLSSTWSLSEFPPLLGGPEAAGEAAGMGGSEQHTSEEATDSEKEINRLSILPFPPSAGSILRRQREEDPAPPKRSFSSMSDITGSVTLKPWSPGLSSSSSSDSVWPLGKPDGLLARGCGLDLLNRSLAIRVSCRSPPGGPESQDKGPDGLSFLGDSWSGAVVRRVLSGPGSARVESREPRAETAGLEGAGLEGEVQQRTLPWNQVSTLPFLMDFKASQSFHEALDAWTKGLSTEPFYIRANLTLPERADPHALCVKAQEILRLVDPAYKRRQEWFCTRVDPLTLRDLDRGTVPNYQRAQQLLEVQEKGLPSSRHRGSRSNLKKRALDQLRLVKPKHGGSPAGDSSEQLLLEPCSGGHPGAEAYPLAAHGVREWHVWGAWGLGGPFDSSSGEQGVQGPERTPGLGRRLRAIQESVGKKHCLLELGARGVRELVQNEIYPIVIHVEVTEKNVREVR